MDTEQGFGELPADELAPGERILWAGKPNPARRHGPHDRAARVFANLWTGVVVAWWSGALSAVSRGESPVVLLLGLPHLGVAVWLKWGRHVHTARLKPRLGYFVTDRRVIAVERGEHADRVRSLDAKDVGRIDTAFRDDGSGTVVFHKRLLATFTGHRTDVRTDFGSIRSSYREVIFYDVDDARRVVEVVEAHWDRPRRSVLSRAVLGERPYAEQDTGGGPDVTRRLRRDRAR